jgi:hypothetical protein
MALVLARLQQRDARKGWLTKDYTSTRGNTYRAGASGVPSPLTKVDDPAELRELREFSGQFEFIEVDDEQHLAELLQYEMEMRVRAGGNPVRAEVLGVALPQPSEPAAPRRRLAAIVPPVGTSPDAPAAPAAAPASSAAVPAPRAIPRGAPRARIDDDGDEVFDPAPIPAAPAGVDEGAPSATPSAGRKGGRRGRS